MTRMKLPDRRPGDVFEIIYAEQRFTVTIGRDDDGRAVEVFLNAHKAKESGLESTARDAAILISIALQHGVSAEDLRRAVTRGHAGDPATVVGCVLDGMAGQP